MCLTLGSWDEAYQVEYENFKDHGDEGEIWYSHTCSYYVYL